jgi:ankyrin repeat protein
MTLKLLILLKFVFLNIDILTHSYKNEFGQTALHLAAEKDNLPVIKLIINEIKERGLSFHNEGDEDGITQGTAFNNIVCSEKRKHN